jgi:HlyD family secretion protein
MIRSILIATVLLGLLAPLWSKWASSISLPLDGASRAVGGLTTLSAAPGDSWQRVQSLLPDPFAAKAPDFRTERAARGDIAATVEAAGTLNALVVVSVGSQISGQIKELYADFNSQVREGEVIARVEPEMYEARVAQAQAELEMAETQIAVQRGQIARAEAELENAEARREAARAHTLGARVALDDAAQEMERTRPLVGRNIVPASQWERVGHAHRTAEAQLAAAEADELSQVAGVRAAQAGLTVARAQLGNISAQVRQKEAVLRQAEIDLEHTYIRAPVNGTVVDRAVSGGQTLAASLQSPVLFTIAKDLTEMQVEASVVEADIGRFAVGQPVVFTVDAYPERLHRGTIKQIRQAPQVVQNVVTYIVVTTAPNPEQLLLPGMTANLEVVTASRANVLKVPNVALRYQPPTGAARAMQAVAAPPAATAMPQAGAPGRVFVAGPGGEPQPVALRLGITDGQTTEVLAGDLAEGQPVIVGATATPAPDETSLLVRFRLR